MNRLLGEQLQFFGELLIFEPKYDQVILPHAYRQLFVLGSYLGKALEVSADSAYFLFNGKVLL